MLKKSITYTDFNGVTKTEDFYFHLSKAELASMELSEKGGLSVHLRQILDTNDQRKIMETFQDLFARSVGRRSADGSRFIKDDDARGAFMQTGAYDVLFLEVLQNTESMIEFITGVVPPEVSGKVDIAAMVRGEKPIPTQDLAWHETRPAVIEAKLPEPKKFEQYTEQELMEMSAEEFNALVGTDVRKMTKDQLIIAMRRRTRE